MTLKETGLSFGQGGQKSSAVLKMEWKGNNMTRPKSPVRLDWVDPAVCSLDYRLKIVGRLPFFKHLPAEAISKINGLFHDHEVSTDERIYFEGDEAGPLVSRGDGKSKTDPRYRFGS